MNKKLPIIAILSALMLSGCVLPGQSSQEGSSTSRRDGDPESSSYIISTSNSEFSSQTSGGTQTTTSTVNFTADLMWPSLGNIGTTGYTDYNGTRNISLNGHSYSCTTDSAAKNSLLSKTVYQLKKYKEADVNNGKYPGSIKIEGIHITKLVVGYICDLDATTNDFKISNVTTSNCTVVSSTDTGTVHYDAVNYKDNVLSYDLSGTGDFTFANNMSVAAYIYKFEITFVSTSGGESSSIYSSSITISQGSTSSSSSSSSASTSITPPSSDTKWTVDLSTYGTTFRNNLSSQINSYCTKSMPGYKACMTVGAAAAAYPNRNSSTFIPFYHSESVTTTTGSCNKEHSWPNSRGGGSIDGDPFMVRPTLTSDNSSRENSFYGTGSSEWDPASCESGFYAARGEAARIILYCATKYYSLGLSLSNNPSDATSAKTMGTLKYLIEWNNTYAPTDNEIRINDYLAKQGYGRNPFVDHPEYANYIWDINGLRGSPVQGGNSGSSTSSSENTSSSSVTPVNYTYHLEDAISDIDGASYIIASSANLNTDVFALTTTNTTGSSGTTYSWYFVGSAVDINSERTGMNITNPVKFKFEKQQDNTYTIYNSSVDKYLYSYIDGTHYSIGMYKVDSDCPGSSISKNWEITSVDGGFTVKSTSGVYLEYFKGSFCGFQYTPTVPIYLFS